MARSFDSAALVACHAELVEASRGTVVTNERFLGKLGMTGKSAADASGAAFARLA
jgi:hypothetical protein